MCPMFAYQKLAGFTKKILAGKKITLMTESFGLRFYSLEQAIGQQADWRFSGKKLANFQLFQVIRKTLLTII